MRYIERQIPGALPEFTPEGGMRIFTAQGKELTAINGDRLFWLWMARECQSMADRSERSPGKPGSGGDF